MPAPGRPHRLVAGTDQARAVAAAGGRGKAAAERRRRWDARIAELIDAAPELTGAQRDRIAAAFCPPVASTREEPTSA